MFIPITPNVFLPVLVPGLHLEKLLWLHLLWNQAVVSAQQKESYRPSPHFAQWGSVSPETVPCWHWWLRGTACLTVALLSGLAGTKRWCQQGEAALAPVCSVISQTNPIATAKNAMAPASVPCDPHVDLDLTGLTSMSTPHLVCGQFFLWTKKWGHSLSVGPTCKRDRSLWKHIRADLNSAIILQNELSPKCQYINEILRLKSKSGVIYIGITERPYQGDKWHC